MHVSALNAQRTAYRKLADDNASILKKLGELKSAGTSEVRASVFECLPRLRVSERLRAHCCAALSGRPRRRGTGPTAAGRRY